MRTENKIFADLRAFITTALLRNGLTDWEVLQNYQPTRGNYPKPHILVHKTAETPIGRLQENSARPELGGQLIKVSFQLDGVKRRKPTDGEDTLNAGDVLQLVRLWFMSSAGVKELRRAGYNVFFIGQINPQTIDTEYDTFEISPNFSLELAFKQEYNDGAGEITAASGVIKGVK